MLEFLRGSYTESIKRFVLIQVTKNSQSVILNLVLRRYFRAGAQKSCSAKRLTYICEILLSLEITDSEGKERAKEYRKRIVKRCKGSVHEYFNYTQMKDEKTPDEAGRIKGQVCQNVCVF